jgi:hypothetical protein
MRPPLTTIARTLPSVCQLDAAAVRTTAASAPLLHTIVPAASNAVAKPARMLLRTVPPRGRLLLRRISQVDAE